MGKASVRFYENDGQMWFHLEKPSTACPSAVPFIFDGPATEKHVAEYQKEYKAYCKEQEEKLLAQVVEIDESVDLSPNAE